MEPEGASLCSFGATDFLASDDGAESFIALYLKDETTYELDITKYNIGDFSADKKKEGYLCTLESKHTLTCLINGEVLINREGGNY